MCWHKWSKWEVYKEHWEKTMYLTEKTIHFKKTLQKRYCIKCNKTQVEEIKPL